MKTSEIKSPQTKIESPVSSVYAFLSNFNNFSNLMPEQVTNWKATDESCSFTIQGMGDFGLKISERIADKLIVIIPDVGKPIPFTFKLICELSPLPEDKTDALIRIETEMPPMIAMMAGRPLQNLVNILAQRLQEYYANKPV
jgi:hypothetical protein